MRFILTSLAFYSSAAAIVVGAQSYLVAIRDNCHPRLGWPAVFAAMSILAFILASNYLEVRHD